MFCWTKFPPQRCNYPEANFLEERFSSLEVIAMETPNETPHPRWVSNTWLEKLSRLGDVSWKEKCFNANATFLSPRGSQWTYCISFIQSGKYPLFNTTQIFGWPTTVALSRCCFEIWITMVVSGRHFLHAPFSKIPPTNPRIRKTTSHAKSDYGSLVALLGAVNSPNFSPWKNPFQRSIHGPSRSKVTHERFSLSSSNPLGCPNGFDQFFIKMWMGQFFALAVRNRRRWTPVTPFFFAWTNGWLNKKHGFNM